MRIHHAAVAAAVVTGVAFAGPALAQTTDQATSGPLQLGQFLKKMTSPAPAPAAEQEDAAPPAPRPVHRRHLARHKAEPVHHRVAVKEAVKEPAKSAPPMRHTAAADPEVATTDGRGSSATDGRGSSATDGRGNSEPRALQTGRPSPAPALGPSPFVGNQAASWPPIPEDAAAPADATKVVPNDQPNALDLAADGKATNTASGNEAQEASVEDDPGRSAQTDARSTDDRTNDADAVTAGNADAASATETPWMPILLVSSGAALLLGYFGWPLLARRRGRVA